MYSPVWSLWSPEKNNKAAKIYWGSTACTGLGLQLTCLAKCIALGSHAVATIMASSTANLAGLWCMGAAFGAIGVFVAAAITLLVICIAAQGAQSICESGIMAPRV